MISFQIKKFENAAFQYKNLNFIKDKESLSFSNTENTKDNSDISSQNSLVSIIVPIYNVEKYLKKCLDSIINQTYINLEIILVNDGSTDSCGAICDKYALQDKRIKVIHKQNVNAGNARNHGLKLASGEFLLFFDADDYICDLKAIEKLILKACETKADIVIAQSKEYHEQNKAFKDMHYALRFDLLPQKNVFSYKDFPKYIFNFCVGWAWDKLYRKSFVDKHKIYFQELPSTNDLYFVFLSLVLAEKITIIKEIFFIHRRGVLGSIENNQRLKNPLVFMKVLFSLQDKLNELEIYDEVRQSFDNFVLFFSLWHLNTAKADFYQVIFKSLKFGLFQMLDLYQHKPEYFFNEKDYLSLKAIQESSVKDSVTNRYSSNQKGQYGAKERVQNQLSYKLGNAIIKSKSPLKILKLPFNLLCIIKEHRFQAKLYQSLIKINPSFALPALKDYADYNEALKAKDHLSYRLGNALINHPFSFVFRVSKIYKDFKKTGQNPTTLSFEKETKNTFKSLNLSHKECSKNLLLFFGDLGVGDYLFLRPFLPALRKYYKDYKISFLGDIRYKELCLELDKEFIDEFIYFVGDRNFTHNALKSFFKTLHYEVLIAPSYLRSVDRDRQISFINADEKIGSYGGLHIISQRNRADTTAYTQVIYPQDEAMFELERNKEFFEQVFDKKINIKNFNFTLQNEHFKDINFDFTQQYAIFFIGATDINRRYEPQKFKQLCIYLYERYKIKSFILGSKDEDTVALELGKGCDFIRSLCGKFSLNDILYILKKARIVICNDSGGYHLAMTQAKSIILIANAGGFTRFLNYPQEFKKDKRVYIALPKDALLNPYHEYLYSAKLLNSIELEELFEFIDEEFKND